MNPEKITNVMQSQFSIARYSGGCIYNGKYYVYDPEQDMLIRDDVFKKEKSDRKRSIKKIESERDFFK